MDSPTYATIILKLTTEIDAISKSFVFNGYNALSHALSKPLASLCTLYIVFIGFGITRGLIKKPIQEFSKGAVRIGLVYMLAMNWGLFSEYIVGLFVSAASELGAALMQSTNISGINNGLQSALTEVVRVGAWTCSKASIRHVEPIFTGIMIYLSGITVIGLALFEIIISKLMLSICLCTAPLFMCFSLFDQTRSFFDKWLGTLAGFSFVLIMVSTVIGLCLHLIHMTMAEHYQTHAANITAVDWIPIFIVACLSVMAILEVTSIAKSIGGGCSTNNGSSMIGGILGGAMSAATIGKSLIPQNIKNKLQGNQTMSQILQTMRGGHAK